MDLRRHWWWWVSGVLVTATALLAFGNSQHFGVIAFSNITALVLLLLCMGILRKALRQYLQKHPHVASVAEPPQNEGGGGATVVELRV